jgi:hypothetical protein
LLPQNGFSRARCGNPCARSPQMRGLCICSSRPYKASLTPCLTGSSSLKSCHVHAYRKIGDTQKGIAYFLSITNNSAVNQVLLMT